jgi:transposase-like protein
LDDVNDDAKGVYRRVEVLTGPGRRRRWSDQQKAVVAAEALVPGAIVAQVARRWQVSASQVFSWRRAALQIKSGQGPAIGPAFVAKRWPIAATRNLLRGCARQNSASRLWSRTSITAQRVASTARYSRNSSLEIGSTRMKTW